MKILIAIPALDFVPTEFALSLATLMTQEIKDSVGRRVPLALWSQKGSIIMDARNAAVDYAQDVGASHLFFLDSDMQIPPSTLQRLVSAQKSVVGASYVRRSPPHALLGTAKSSAPIRDGLCEMLNLPLGCCLINMTVFEKLPRPYFRYVTAEGGSISEDTWFCMQCAEQGVQLWQHTGLTAEVGHVGSKVYTI